MMAAPRDSTEDDRDVFDGSTLRPQRERTGFLVLGFEAGRPRAVRPFSLAGVDAVTLGRTRDVPLEQVTQLAGERRLVVQLADRRMSQVHAHLRREGGQWVCEDAQSKNGTRVNGQSVSRAILRTGDLLEFGRSFIVFSSDGAEDFASPEGDGVSGLMTSQPDLARQFRQLTTLARSSANIMVRGESGTGKELVAKAVHRLSGRSGALRDINCGALPRSLLESELFGYRKGAFSGATEDRPGMIRSADKGTLFLDEIGDLPFDAQPALLRTLQEKEVRPVGSVNVIPVDMRVVAATHRDLEAMVAQERFRQDLLARLTDFTITLPPLRNRLEDLGALVRVLVDRHARAGARSIEFSSAVIRRLYGHPWKHNIRELDKTVSTALLLCEGAGIELEHLPQLVRIDGDLVRSTAGGHQDPSRGLVEGLVARHGGNVAAVAREMHTSRAQVHRLCRRFGVDPAAYRAR